MCRLSDHRSWRCRRHRSGCGLDRTGARETTSRAARPGAQLSPAIGGKVIGATDPLSTPKVVPHEEWRAARKAIIAHGESHARELDPAHVDCSGVKVEKLELSSRHLRDRRGLSFSIPAKSCSLSATTTQSLASATAAMVHLTVFPVIYPEMGAGSRKHTPTLLGVRDTICAEAHNPGRGIPMH